MGGKKSKPIDVNAIISAERAQWEQQRLRLEQAANQQRENERKQHERIMTEAVQKAREEQKRMQEAFEARQKELLIQMENDRRTSQAMIDSLNQGLMEMKQKMEAAQIELQLPMKNRQAAIDFVNGLKLKVRLTENILLLGPKGHGKTTFGYLLGKCQKPEKTYSRDASTEILHIDGFTDTIGLQGWTPEDLTKLFVLLLYRGFPQDVIVFNNTTRVLQPVAALASFGVVSPMLVLMESSFWETINDLEDEIQLKPDRDGVLRVYPESKLKRLYKLRDYENISNLHMAHPVTHHNVLTVIQQRKAANLTPFQNLLNSLGEEVTVRMDMSAIPNMEMLFRFLYLYEKKFGKDDLKFLNEAKLNDFTEAL